MENDPVVWFLKSVEGHLRSQWRLCATVLALSAVLVVFETTGVADLDRPFDSHIEIFQVLLVLSGIFFVAYGYVRLAL